MIDGNKTLTLEIKSAEKNDIGENEASWKPYKTIKNGFLDMGNGDTRRTEYNRAATESSHIFFCSYTDIDRKESELRATIDGKPYEVNYIDNPLGLNEHLEIYLGYKDV